MRSLSGAGRRAPTANLQEMPSVQIPERAKLAALVAAALAVVVLWGYLLTASPKSDPYTPPPGLAAAGATPAAAPIRVTAWAAPSRRR